ncbi:MAG TPA: hypothetical protein VEB19_16400 [Gemmatimonadaceae bacterium]|nr:hypothetical protein [Gemmatimonadaceae bacterium]
MSEYRIEKLKRDVSVQLANGQRLEGQMFLRPVSRHRARSEDPLELLNDVEPFFPLMLANGKAMLVSKSGVALVETAIEDEDQDLTALGYLVEVTLTDGSTCRGSVFVERQPGRQRLYDFLNAWPSRFMTVVNTDKVILVNTQTIAHVREVD